MKAIPISKTIWLHANFSSKKEDRYTAGSSSSPAQEGRGLRNSLSNTSKSSTEKVHICVCTVCVWLQIDKIAVLHNLQYNVNCVPSIGDAQWLLGKHQEIVFMDSVRIPQLFFCFLFLFKSREQVIAVIQSYICGKMTELHTRTVSNQEY